MTKYYFWVAEKCNHIFIECSEHQVCIKEHHAGKYESTLCPKCENWPGFVDYPCNGGKKGK